MATNATRGPTCPTCHDLGWTHLDVMPGHSDFGRPIRCDCQRERDRARAAERARAASNLTPEMADLTFETFRQQTPTLREAAGALEQFARQPEGWVVLTGDPGMGKTHLLAATAHRLMATGRAHPLYVVAPDFLDYLRDGFADDAIGADQSARMRQAIDADVLLLDDLGAEKRTAWTDERMYLLLNLRYNRRAPTVIASNVPYARLEERIADRMQDRAISREFALMGKSFRRSDAQLAKVGKRQRLAPSKG